MASLPRSPHARAVAGRGATLQTGTALLGMGVSGAVAWAAFLLHFNLSAAGSAELLVIVAVALRWGFLQATAASLSAVILLNFLFTPPLFEFTVADPRNWISLATFEGAALLVSMLSAKAQRHAADAERERMRMGKLYELSRAILLIDGLRPTGEQLAGLIGEMLTVDAVELYAAHDRERHRDGRRAAPHALATYQTGVDSDDPQQGTSRRVLRLGTLKIGAMALSGWEVDPLLADAVASLAAIALERARALEKENRAEAARDAEQLRGAVLDGLAHGFKTPLTAIQMASSGLLAIGSLTGTQAELVSLIDERAHTLGQLTTRLLQTAALESKEMRLRRGLHSLPELASEVLDQVDGNARERVEVLAPPGLRPIEIDGQLVRLSLLQLVDNAAKYADVDGPIRVSFRQDAEETTVVVENGGSTIRPEERERIFERFYRGAEAQRGPTGTGLGLSIVKKTAEAHGGRAWVECEEDRTRFFFTMARYGGARNA